MPVDFSVTNQLASPAIYASSFATRPAASFKGRLFVDTNVPSTGIYRDTGTAWVAIAGSAAEAQSLNAVCVVGNTTTTLGIKIFGQTAFGESDIAPFGQIQPFGDYAVTIGAYSEFEKSLFVRNDALFEKDILVNNLNIGRGGGNYIENTSLGADGALIANTDGVENTAIGYKALNSNTEGNANTSIGANSLILCNSGTFNTAIGAGALNNVTEGGGNIGIGYNAGNVVDGARNIFIGNETALTTTSNTDNVVIGYGATAPSGNNQFVIGTAAQNVGSVVVEVHGASTRVWNVYINGVARKIMLA